MNDFIPLIAIGAILAAVVFLWLPPHPDTRPFASRSFTGRVKHVVNGGPSILPNIAPLCVSEALTRLKMANMGFWPQPAS